MGGFVAPPDWQGLIVCYVLLGGIAAGAYVMATLIDLFGQEEDQRGARPAYYLTFPLVCVCGLLLLLALGPPEWSGHGMNSLNANRSPRNGWSSRSIGAWGVGAFGVLSCAAFVGALLEDGWFGGQRAARWAARLRASVVGRALAVGGCASACFLGGYSSALLTAMNQPIWSDTTWIGALFLATSASMGAAALVLLTRWVRPALDREVIGRIDWLGCWAIVLELMLLAAFAVSLEALAVPGFTRWPGVLVPGLVVPFGLALPLALRAVWGARMARLTAFATLAGGLILRYALVGMPESLLTGAP